MAALGLFPPSKPKPSLGRISGVARKRHSLRPARIVAGNVGPRWSDRQTTEALLRLTTTCCCKANLLNIMYVPP